MSFVVDTDICSAFLNGDRNVFNRFAQYSGGLTLSTITVGELLVRARRGNASVRLAAGLQSMLRHVTVLPVDLPVAELFGTTRAELLDRGITVPPTDMFIAATALVYDYTVVMHNRRHFDLVPGLGVQDWLIP